MSHHRLPRSLRISRRLTPLVLLGCLALLPRGTAAQGFEEEISISGNSLQVQNLIGEIQVVGHDGPEFMVRVHVQGEDATRDRVQLERKEGGTPTVVVRFPVEESTTYVYPHLGKNSKSTFLWNPGGGKTEFNFKDLFGMGKNRRIQVRGGGEKGLEIWADLEIRVPKGAKLHVYDGCGAVSAADVEGALKLAVQSGGVSAERIAGNLVADTGSGKIQVLSVKGAVVADTGSGSVLVEDVVGDVSADTGSGDVTVRRIRAGKLAADTGSGSVELDDIVCDVLMVDTGSGGIEVTAATIGSGVLDTGSGGVELTLAGLTKGPVRVDTGSGSVLLVMPPSPSATVNASTGSGGIHVDLEGVDWIRKSDSEKSFRIGKGDAKIVLETGSGSIRVRS